MNTASKTVIAVMVFGTLAGCGTAVAQSLDGSARAGNAGTRDAPSSTTAAAPAPGLARAGQTECSVLTERVTTAIQRGGACTTVADCALYQGGLRAVTNCGGITDRATATEVGSLVTRALIVCRQGELRQASCAPLSCLADCDAGRCVCQPNPAAAPVRPRRRSR